MLPYMTNIVTGEKIQQLCDIYLGDQSDFNWNPLTKSHTSKHVNFYKLVSDFNNPYYVFCNSHNLNLLSQKLGFFQNEFILVTHNSDGQIEQTDVVFDILNCDKILKWYGQNICFEHPKLFFLPIGLANQQWKHGNLSLFYDATFMNSISTKPNNIYFNFNISTNKSKRQICYDKLKHQIEWLIMIDPQDNLKRLASYKFCICPEGNGVDTHRLWECIYLKVVPIVIKSEFTTILQKQNIPLHVLDEWDSLDTTKLNYHDFDFTHLENSICNFNYIKCNAFIM